MNLENKREYKPTDYDPFEGDFGDFGDVKFSDKMVKGRKEYECSHCKGIILKNEIHRSLVGKFEGELSQYRWCKDCCEAMVKELIGLDEDEAENECEDEFPFENRLNKFAK